MRTVNYARVSDPSTQDTKDKVSIDQQLAEMRALCERMGWQIVEEFVDLDSREKLELLLDFANRLPPLNAEYLDKNLEELGELEDKLIAEHKEKEEKENSEEKKE